MVKIFISIQDKFFIIDVVKIIYSFQIPTIVFYKKGSIDSNIDIDLNRFNQIKYKLFDGLKYCNSILYMMDNNNSTFEEALTKNEQAKVLIIFIKEMFCSEKHMQKLVKALQKQNKKSNISVLCCSYDNIEEHIEEAVTLILNKKLRGKVIWRC